MSEALRVLLVSGEYPPMEGGVSDFTHLLGEAFVAKGAEVHVLTARRARQVGPERCHPLLDSWGWGALYRNLYRLYSAIKPDVVNIQYQTAAYGMHPAINFLPLLARRVPVVVTYHDLLVPYLFPKAGPVRWWVTLAPARWASAVIATNAPDRERLAGYPWLKKLELIPIGSNIPARLPANYARTAWREHLGVGAEALVLCYFGFLNASKGGEELIEALDELTRAGRDAHLLMIGGAVGASDPTNRAYLARVQDAIRARGLSARVHWTGYMPPEEVSASFAASDLCVLPYRDGVSFRRGSFMAALTHGMPIVTTYPQGKLPELQDGDNVFLVPPQDATALAQAIARLADQAALRARLGEGARKLAGEFDWQRIAARTLEVYHAVTGR